jgi:hypothetical protein
MPRRRAQRRSQRPFGLPLAKVGFVLHSALDGIDKLLQGDEFPGRLLSRGGIGERFGDHLPAFRDEVIAQMPEAFEMLFCHYFILVLASPPDHAWPSRII